MTFGPAVKTTTTVDSIPVSETWQSVDGLTSGGKSFGSETLTVRSLPSGGAWTVTTTAADGTKSVQTHGDGRLVEDKKFDNQGTAAANLVAATSHTYDSHGRVATTTDSRTGTTTMGDYTESGNLLSMTAPGNRVTSFTHDKMGRRLTVDAPDTADANGNNLTNVTTTRYDLAGRVVEITGGQTYRVAYTYDYAGRLKSLTTYGTATATTAWNYDPQRGWLTGKRHGSDSAGTTGSGPEYTYTPAGRIKTRTWVRGVVATHDYDRGMLAAVTYTNDPAATPNLAYTYDSLGRLAGVTQTNRSRITYTHAADLGVDTETIQYDLDHDGAFDFTRVLDRHQRSHGRDTGWQLRDTANPPAVDNSATYTHDDAGRLGTVSGPGDTFTYGYLAGSHALTATITSQGGNHPARTVTNTWDPERDILSSKENKVGASTVSSYDYSVVDQDTKRAGVNDAGQRTGVATGGSAFGGTDRGWAWGYDSLGQVTKAAKMDNSNHHRAYEFDAIGNRLLGQAGATAIPTPPNASTTGYTPNALNQYEAITPHDAEGDPGTPVEPLYDGDGNMTAGPLPVSPSANRTLVWDAENRLIEVKNGTTSIVTYTYDALGRRISRTAGSGTTLYLYDGWNCIAEYTGTNHELGRSYTWGPDLSGTLQGAGGVGGLLAVRIGSTGYYPTFDGNGNVSEYLTVSGSVAAHFEYDPFGNTVVVSELTDGLAALFDYRFSTKPLDSLTGLYYYAYRWYDPLTGRWLSRDPIEERGGVNLYGFVENGGVNQWDLLGLEFYIGYAPLPDEIDQQGRLIKASRTYGEWADAQFSAEESNQRAREYFREIAAISESEFKKKTSNGVFVIWKKNSVQNAKGVFVPNEERIKVNVTRGQLLLWLREEQGSMAELYKTDHGEDILMRFTRRSNEELYHGYEWTSSAFAIHSNRSAGRGFFADGTEMTFDELRDGISGVHARGSKL